MKKLEIRPGPNWRQLKKLEIRPGPNWRQLSIFWQIPSTWPKIKPPWRDRARAGKNSYTLQHSLTQPVQPPLLTPTPPQTSLAN